VWVQIDRKGGADRELLCLKSAGHPHVEDILVQVPRRAPHRPLKITEKKELKIKYFLKQ